jgi:small subunit ribosomal protein S18
MKQCYFCTNSIKNIDYKNPELFKQFIDELAKIRPKRETKLCSKHQRRLAQAVKRARFLGLLPFVGE